MSDQLELYKLLHDESVAMSMGKVLDEAGIPYEIRRSKKYFDVSFANNQVDPEVNLFVRPGDFGKANHALKDFYAQQADGVEPDYYLLSFSDQELIDIIRKQDEWGSFDVALARKLLHERGIEITDETEAEVERKRLEELSKPAEAPAWLILAGYVSACMGGFFGIILGFILVHTKVLPNGNRVPVYTQSDRTHGQFIRLIGFAVFSYLMARMLWLSYR